MLAEALHGIDSGAVANRPARPLGQSARAVVAVHDGLYDRAVVESAIRLGLVLLWSGLAVYLLIVWLTARAMLRPPRMTDGKALHALNRLTPDDLNLAYQAMDFEVADNASPGRSLRLKAWWIPPQRSDGRSVLLIHGYADAKIGAIAWAPLLHGLGLGVLAVDLRAHGESDGAVCSAGFYERHDIDQLINQFQALMPEQTRALYVMGISLGATVAAGVGGLRDDLRGIILDSPYLDYRQAVLRHAELTNGPGPFIQTPALKLAEWQIGADFDELAMPKLIAQAKCPVLLFSADRDLLLTDADQAQLRQSLLGRTNHRDQYCSFADAAHNMSLVADPDAYEQALRQFLESTG